MLSHLKRTAPGFVWRRLETTSPLGLGPTGPQQSWMVCIHTSPNGPYQRFFLVWFEPNKAGVNTPLITSLSFCLPLQFVMQKYEMGKNIMVSVNVNVILSETFIFLIPITSLFRTRSRIGSTTKFLKYAGKMEKLLAASPSLIHLTFRTFEGRWTFANIICMGPH